MEELHTRIKTETWELADGITQYIDDKVLCAKKFNESRKAS